MSQLGPVTGILSAVSGNAINPAQGSVVQFSTPLKQIEHQCLIVLSGTYTGVQVVIEAQDLLAMAPFYGIRSWRQDTGVVVWGGTAIAVPDNPAGTNAATAIIAAIEGAGLPRIRCVGLTSGQANVLLAVGSFFAGSPVTAASSSTGNTFSPANLKVMRAVERLLSLQAGLWVPVGTDDGFGNQITVDPSLGDTVG